MPADSEFSLPRTWRPLGVRVAGAFFFVMLMVVCAAAWIGLGAEVRARFTGLQRATLVGLGLAMLGVIYGLGRCRVTATVDGVQVVNFYRSRRYEWPQVLGVRMPRGAPWASFDLNDGTTVALMGIQGSDGARATTAVRELRSLVDEYGTTPHD